MLYLNQLHHLNRLSTLDRLEIERYREALSSKHDEFQQIIQDWLNEQNFGCEDGCPILLEGYFKSLTSTALDDSFYVIQYHQALHWLNCGLTQNHILLLLNRIQKQFILYSDEFGSQNLGSGLVHFLDIGESIVSSVFQVSRSVERMKSRCHNEIRRLKSAFKLLDIPIPMDVFQAYIDHQNWKATAFELALGRQVDLTAFEASHTRCDLAKWLDSGGLEKIPESERQGFQQAHEMVHRLGLLAIEESRNNSPEGIVELLFEMEKNSEELMEVLLSILERDLVRNAESNSLKGFLDPSLVELELEKSVAFARRNDFWLDLVLIEIDHFNDIQNKRGEPLAQAVVEQVGGCIKTVARTEDLVFQLEAHRFMVMAMGRESEGAEVLAERLRQLVDETQISTDEHERVNMSISCGAISFWAGLRTPSADALTALAKQLDLAQNSGGNQVQHSIIDVVVPVEHDRDEVTQVDKD